MTNDNTLKLKTEDVMEAYNAWSIERGLSSANIVTVGTVVRKFFSPIVRQVCKKGVKKYTYEGMRFVQNTDPVPRMEMLTHAENVAIRQLGAVIDVQVGTKYIKDGNKVNVLASLNTATGSMGMIIDGVVINDALLKSYGLYTKDTLSQKFVTGLTVMCNNMKLCLGRDYEMTDDSSVPEHHVWVIVTGLYDPEILRMHSKNCAIMLGFSACAKTNSCGACVHDIG